MAASDDKNKVAVKQEKEVEEEEGYPGFRFHPTEEELVGFYLKKKCLGKLRSFRCIPVLDLYRYDPWELPWSGTEKEMYFFVEKDESSQRKCGRPNRITASGYWKATGSDRSIWDESMSLIGHKKTLVFYRGRAPRGHKTDWVMNEFRLPQYNHFVLCRIHRKATPQKWLERQALQNAQLNNTNNNTSDSNKSVCTGEVESESMFLKSAGNLEMELMHENSNFTVESDADANSHSNSTTTCYENEEGTVYNGSLGANSSVFENGAALEVFLCENTKPFLDFPIPALCVDSDVGLSRNTNSMMVWEDLSWSPSSLLCTPTDFSHHLANVNSKC